MDAADDACRRFERRQHAVMPPDFAISLPPACRHAEFSSPLFRQPMPRR